MSKFTNPFENCSDILNEILKAQNEFKEQDRLEKERRINSGNVTVGISSDCDFNTINEAIHYVKDGCVIHIKPGLYVEQIEVTKQLSFVGDGGVIIQQTQGYVCKVLKDASFKNIKFENTKKSTQTDVNSVSKNTALVFCKSNVSFESCNFKNSYGNGIVVDEAVEVSVTNCTFHNMNNLGIYLEKCTSFLLKDSKITTVESHCLFFVESKVTMENCVLSNSENGGGICCGSGSEVTVRNCEIHDTYGGSGIHVYSSGKVTIKGCEIYRTKFAGIQCHGTGSEGIVTHCKIHDIKENCGIDVYSSGKVTIGGCEIYGTKFAGIQCYGTGSEGIITNCKIHDIKENCGILVYNAGKVTAKGCEISQTKLAGIICQNFGSEINISDSKIYEISEDYCMAVSNSGIINAEKCELLQSRFGIVSKDNAQVRATYCKVHSLSEGIVVYEAGKLKLSSCTISYINDVGILCESSYIDVENCAIYQIGKNGIEVKDAGDIWVKNCNFDSMNAAIYINKGCKFEIDSNIFGNNIKKDIIKPGLFGIVL